MLRVAVAKLETPEGDKLILQRRNSITPLFPHGLGFFGGHIEEHESPAECIERELGEETLGLDNVKLLPMTDLTVLPPATGTDEEVEVHVFHGTLDNTHLGFIATEDAGVEIYDYETALQQQDLIPTTRYVLERIKEQ